MVGCEEAPKGADCAGCDGWPNAGVLDCGGTPDGLGFPDCVGCPKAPLLAKEEKGAFVGPVGAPKGFGFEPITEGWPNAPAAGVLEAPNGLGFCPKADGWPNAPPLPS